MAPLDVGGRLTGRTGAYTVGVLAARTGDVEGAGTLTTIDPAAFGVVRVKRDVLRRSSLGGMVTYRSSTPGRIGSNLGYGADANFSFYQNVSLNGYLAGTQTENRSGDNLSYRHDVQLQRRPLRCAGRPAGRRAKFPSGDWIHPSHRMRRNFGQLRYSPRPQRQTSSGSSRCRAASRT